jgi:hypothetical protein
VPLGTADASLKQRMQIPETQDFFCFEGQSHASEENCDGAVGWMQIRGRDGRDAYKWDIKQVNARLKKLEKEMSTSS